MNATFPAGNATLSESLNATLPESLNATLPESLNAALPTTNATQAASTASTSVLPPVEFSWGGYFEAIGVMLILLACLWGALWVVRRYGKFRFIPAPGAFPRGGLVVETQLPLGPRKGLFVVRYLNQRLLLGVTDQQITLLQENHMRRQDAADEHADSVDEKDAELFARMLAEEGGPDHVPAKKA